MSETIAVVNERDALLDAYELGHNRGSRADVTGDPRADEDPDFDLSEIKSSASWDNIVDPKLRAMAGYGDDGHGTYQVERQIALVPPGNEDDDPAEARLRASPKFYVRLADAYDMGARDGAEGSFDPDSALH